MKRLFFSLCFIFLISGSTYLHLKKGVTRFELPKGELRWSNKRPQNAKMCIPAAFTDEHGKILGAYRIEGKSHEANKTMRMRVSLKGDIFFISRSWMGDNGFQQLTLVNNSRTMKFNDTRKSIRRALCKDNKGAFILQSNYPMTMSDFAIECGKRCTNATYLDMGEYGYGYIKYGLFTIPLYVWGYFTRDKQTNWLYIE